jgi:predicted ester cyclase
LQDRLLRLWGKPPPEGERGLAAFGELYADPVRLNGSRLPLPALVDRARAVHAAFVDLQFEVLRTIETSGAAALVFRFRGRQVGPLLTPLGEVPATGRPVEVLTIDVLGLEDGKVAELWVVPDELGRLMQLEAVRLAVPA